MLRSDRRCIGTQTQAKSKQERHLQSVSDPLRESKFKVGIAKERKAVWQIVQLKKKRQGAKEIANIGRRVVISST